MLFVLTLTDFDDAGDFEGHDWDRVGGVYSTGQLAEAAGAAWLADYGKGEYMKHTYAVTKHTLDASVGA